MRRRRVTSGLEVVAAAIAASGAIRMLNRRDIVIAGLAALVPGDYAVAANGTDSLRQAATAGGLLYGTAVSSQLLTSDLNFASLVAQQANILVAEGETKRKSLQPTPTRYDFTGTDSILAFAQSHKQQMRGHNLAWHYGNPDWLLQVLDGRPDDKVITDYVSKVVGRYRGKFQSWDVVNEVVDPGAGRPDGMRGSSPWFKAFGERYIDLAFHAAREADPNVPLYMNELDTEIDIGWSQDVRRASLDLIDRLLARKVPVTGFGIESHLKAFRFRYSDKVFSRFLDDLGSRGLEVLITELDIADINGPSDQSKRDAGVAALAKSYLDVAFSKPFVRGCLTWGITDRYTWLASDPKYSWANGNLPRALPFDENYQPTPMYTSMIDAYYGK